MTAAQSPVAPRAFPTLPLTVVSSVALAVFFAVWRLDLSSIAFVNTFAIIFVAIVVEAIPFVLLGAIVAALIEVYVPDRFFLRIGGLPAGLQLPAAVLSGAAFPVCECGSVPVARRLISRGVHPSAGLAFMLASPVFNPIVLMSTWVAYQPRGVGAQMVLGRAGLGILLALAAGWALGDPNVGRLLRKERDATDTPHQPRRIDHLVAHISGDFFFMGKFLLLGAALAAGLQTTLPQSIVSGLADNPLIAIVALMGVAFVSSLCSEADAFVAVSFAQFPLGSQLAFLVFGPILDLKLTFLYSATFRRYFVARLFLVATPVVVAGALWFEFLVGP